jgi:hypothetical protein
MRGKHSDAPHLAPSAIVRLTCSVVPCLGIGDGLAMPTRELIFQAVSSILDSAALDAAGAAAQPGFQSRRHRAGPGLCARERNRSEGSSLR